MTEDKNAFTYAKSGVDIKAQKNAHKIIGELIAETYSYRKGKFGEVVGEYGHYAGLIDIGNDLCLAMHVDGVGTKILIAQMLNKYDTIGIDLIAMHANDLICMGAEPVALEDYLAIETVNDEIIKQIVSGLVKGARQAQMAIIGGETAIMPDIIKGIKPDLGMDLSGMSIGIVNKNKIITGDKIQVNDHIIGLHSNGLHSNGYTLARKAFFEIAKLKPTDLLHPSIHTTIGEELLKPTAIYVKPIMQILQDFPNQVHGLAHITGGAFSKLYRLVPKNHKIGFLINNLPPIPLVFKQIQTITNLSYLELFKTFNMGIGFCIVANPDISQNIISTCYNLGFPATLLGQIISDHKVIINLNKSQIVI